MRVLLFVFAVLVSACAPQSEREPQRAPPSGQVSVVEVIDGDTVEVVDEEQHRYKLRLRGADAPELSQPWGEEARACLRSAIGGRSLRLSFDIKVRQEELVSDLYRDSQSLSMMLVNWGCAWWDQQTAPYDLPLGSAQDRARRAGRGLWKNPAAIAPWDWREKL